MCPQYNNNKKKTRTTMRSSTPTYRHRLERKKIPISRAICTRMFMTSLFTKSRYGINKTSEEEFQDGG
jgi:hypothetical protein